MTTTTATTLRDDSQEESLENDSDLESTVCINNSGVVYNKNDDVLYQLVKAIFFVCIEVPVEYEIHLLNVSSPFLTIKFS